MEGEKQVQGSDVKGILMFPSEASNEERTILEYMSEFIVAATPMVLEAFLTFSAGAPSLPDYGLGRIRIEFDDVESIFFIYFFFVVA